MSAILKKYRPTTPTQLKYFLRTVQNVKKTCTKLIEETFQLVWKIIGTKTTFKWNKSNLIAFDWLKKPISKIVETTYYEPKLNTRATYIKIRV